MPESLLKKKQELDELKLTYTQVKPDKTATVLSKIPKKAMEQLADSIGEIGKRIKPHNKLQESYSVFLRSLSAQNKELDMQYYQHFINVLNQLDKFWGARSETAYEAFRDFLVASGTNLSIEHLSAFETALLKISKLSTKAQDASTNMLSEMFQPAYWDGLKDKPVYFINHEAALKKFEQLVDKSYDRKPLQRAYLQALCSQTSAYTETNYASVEQFFDTLLKFLETSKNKNHDASDSLLAALFKRDIYPGYLNDEKSVSKLFALLEKVNSSSTLNEEEIERIGTMLGRAMLFFPGDQKPSLFSKLLEASLKFGSEELSAFFAVYHAETVQSAKEKERIPKAKQMVNVFRKLGIDFYERYGGDILDNVYHTVSDNKFSDGKKIAAIILNKNDWNKAFENNNWLYRRLIHNGYALIICEADTEYQVALRFLNYGFEKEEKTAVSGRTYDLLLLGGHGTPWSINFGKTKNKAYFAGGLNEPIRKIVDEIPDLDLSDFKQFNIKLFSPGGWAERFSPNSAIVLESCSTGGTLEKGEVMENPGNFQNIMEMIGSFANKPDDGKTITIFAPKLVTGLQDFIFEKGRLIDVKYTKGATNIYNPKGK